MLGRVRRESLAAGKKVVFTSEYWRPQYIGHIDAALTLFSTGDTRGEFIQDVIYHDYLATKCTELLGRPVVPFVGGLFMAGRGHAPFSLAEKYFAGRSTIRSSCSCII